MLSLRREREGSTPLFSKKHKSKTNISIDFPFPGLTHNDFGYDIDKTLGLQIFVNIDAYD